MTGLNPYVSDPKLFAECKAEIETCCRLGEQLPAQVFLDRLKHFAFEEFDWAMSKDFWATLQVLLRLSGDQSLLIGVLDPEPIDYYKREFGYYNWAILSSAGTADEYWALLNHHPEGSPADSLLSNSERVVWAARSGAWAVWGERRLEICVLAYRDINVTESGSWHGLNWVLQDILPGCFRNRVVPVDFIRHFKANYRSEIC